MEKTLTTVPIPTASNRSVPTGRLIIADDGNCASILHLEGLRIGLGFQFRWAGNLWEIVAIRPHAKAFVAHLIEN